MKRPEAKKSFKIPFCDFHIQSFLDSYSPEAPLDFCLNQYFRAHKSLGPRDRKAIAEVVYARFRWKSLIEWLSPSQTPRSYLQTLKQTPLPPPLQDDRIPQPLLWGLPDWLYSRWIEIFGQEKAQELAQISNEQAPTTVRANRLKTTREQLLEFFQKEQGWSAFLCENAPDGVQLASRQPLFSLPQFRQGLFEMQDEGSQKVAACVQPLPGDHVLDFCSGSGGKTLAFAPAMQGRGQIYLHDIRPSALQQARQRLRRAGIQNAQFLLPEALKQKRLQGKVDWVLADVPCSGTGTFRRNPDMKWKLSPQSIEDLVSLQQSIVTEASRYLKPGGKLVYATCSILPEENERQSDYLIKHLSLEPCSPPLHILPSSQGSDGFYAAVFLKPEIR